MPQHHFQNLVEQGDGPEEESRSGRTVCTCLGGETGPTLQALIVGPLLSPFIDKWSGLLLRC